MVATILVSLLGIGYFYMLVFASCHSPREAVLLNCRSADRGTSGTSGTSGTNIFL